MLLGSDVRKHPRERQWLLSDCAIPTRRGRPLTPACVTFATSSVNASAAFRLARPAQELHERVRVHRARQEIVVRPDPEADGSYR
jgi:hypothetical protein